MPRKCTLLPLILVFLAACGPAKAAPTLTKTSIPSPAALPNTSVLLTAAPGVLYVDAGKDLGPISPYVYGSNFGPWTAVPFGMMNFALNSHVTALRFPGGNWGDQNDLQDYQIDMFMAFCKQIGAIPTITVRLLNGTPAAAAELVRYTNIEKGYGVVYWAIGNEPNLYAGLPGENYDTVRYNQDWRTFAKAMKAVDPSIKFNWTGIKPVYSRSFRKSQGRQWPGLDDRVPESQR